MTLSVLFQCTQSTHMASQKITEEAVYLCTGNPLPKDIEQISHWLLNESFAESFKRIHYLIPLWFLQAGIVCLKSFYTLSLAGISDMKTIKGLALVDIVREVTM